MSRTKKMQKKAKLRDHYKDASGDKPLRCEQPNTIVHTNESEQNHPDHTAIHSPHGCTLSPLFVRVACTQRPRLMAGDQRTEAASAPAAENLEGNTTAGNVYFWSSNEIPDYVTLLIF